MSPGRFVIVFALAALTLVLGLMSVRLWEDLQALRTADGENLQWTIVQLDTETARLHAALLEQAEVPTPDPSVVGLRTSIALSRIGLVQEGNAKATLAQDKEAPALLDALEEYAVQAARILDAEEGITPANLQRLIDLTREVRPVARRLALIGNTVGARNSVERRRAFAGQLRRTGLVAVSVIAALACALIALDRLLRVADQRDKALRASSDRLASTIAASLDAIVTTDASGRIVGFNTEAEEMFGWSSAEILGRSMERTLSPVPSRPEDAVPGSEEGGREWSVLAGKGRVEIMACRKAGEHFPAEMNVAAVQEESGGLLICYFRDISDRKINEQRLIQARDRAQRLDRAKTQFLTIMSHEMRTPLNGIMGLLDLMRSTDLSPEQDRYARIATGSAELLLQQANEALDITRIEAGAVKLSNESFGLSDLLARTVELLEPLAIRKGLSIELVVDPAMNLTFLGDEDRIRQIVTNLIGNGIKFTNSGSVSVSLSGIHGRDVTDAEIVVSDTGVGIPEDQQEAIFEDFVMLSHPTGREDRGDGLGLSISRRIARLMGGDLTVSSLQGQGSAFTLAVPLRRGVPGEERGMTMPADDAIAARAQKVLVVEDNAVSQSVLSEMLQKMGHDVTLASNGYEGLEAAGKEAFDLIIMDISMPLLDGLETTGRIRRGSGPNRDSRIIGLTAHGPQEFRDKADAVGMTGLATKPLRFRKLRELLDEGPAIGTNTSGLESDVFDDLVAALGLERVGEIAVKLRGELRLMIEDLKHGGAAMGGEEIGKRLHNLQGASALLGFGALKRGLDAVRENWERQGANQGTGAEHELVSALEEYSNELDALLQEIGACEPQDA